MSTSKEDFFKKSVDIIAKKGLPGHLVTVNNIYSLEVRRYVLKNSIKLRENICSINVPGWPEWTSSLEVQKSILKYLESYYKNQQNTFFAFSSFKFIDYHLHLFFTTNHHFIAVSNKFLKEPKKILWKTL
tara:strand:+ start:822 stop:1211 length:390 start_codon:yes stop_codon:yes gene_type:complete